MEGTTSPGFNFMIPYITSVDYVQVTVQTDRVTNIPCGTSAGVIITFERIEVVNRLNANQAWGTIKNYTINYDKTWIFDKIHHEINQFCSKHTLREVYIDQFDLLDERLGEALQKDCNIWAPGIEIVAVRVTKPKIPLDILSNFENMEKEKTNLLISMERQKVRKIESESAKNISQMVAETEALVSEISMTKQFMIKNATQYIEKIDIKMANEKQTTEADARNYRAAMQKEIEGLRLSEHYLQYKMIGPTYKNSIIFIGSQIPKYMPTEMMKELKEEK